MAKEQSGLRERQRIELKEPRRYKVTIYNDDFTTMEYRLSPTSNQYVKAFYRQNVYDWLEGYTSEYGGGYLWKRKLDSLFDIFRRQSTVTNRERMNRATTQTRDSARTTQTVDSARTRQTVDSARTTKTP